jgi:hypothetical protein
VGADDVSGEQWQPIADIHVEGVGLTRADKMIAL